MRHTLAPAVWFSALATVLVASPLWAQSVFVIQLGTFPNKQEAEQKWDALKKSQPEVLGPLSMHVAEAILQPDNVTLYRTQAGPFRNKIDAQTACGKLKAAKTECLVAETALFVPDQAPSQQLAAAAPAPLPPELPPINKTEAKPVTVISTAAEKADAATVASMPAATPATEQKSSGWFSWMHNPFSSDQPAPAQTAQANITPPPPPPAPYTAAAPAPVSPVQQTASAQGANRPGQTVFYGVAEPKPETSAKSWLPNTNDDKPKTQLTALSAPAATPTPTVARLNALTSTTKMPADNSPAAGTAVAQATAAAIANPPPPPPPAQFAAPLPPPPPLPPVQAVAQASSETVSFDSAFPATAGAAPITIRAKNLEAEPVDMAAVPPPPPAYAQPQPVGAAPWARSNTYVGDKAQVKVAEAIHVPLSTGRVVTSANPSSFHGMPSQSIGLRSYWAQLSYFPDDRNALDFWQGFSANRPEFSNMRLRLVRPYLTRGRAAKTSLRVGPFDSADDIGNLCSAATSRGLRCYAVADMGSSTVANAPRNRAPVPLRYQAAADSGAEVSGYWLQLGTYRSAHEAEETWDQLQDANSDILKKVNSKVSVPALSSSPQAKYRLRAGPFGSDMAANDLCRKLKFRNVSCLVVSGQ